MAFKTVWNEKALFFWGALAVTSFCFFGLPGLGTIAFLFALIQVIF